MCVYIQPDNDVDITHAVPLEGRFDVPWWTGIIGYGRKHLSLQRATEESLHISKFWKLYITSNQRGTLKIIRGRDNLVIGFITTYAISVHHHKICEFEFRSVEIYSIQHNVIEFVSDLRQVGGFFPGTPVSPNNKTEGNDKTEILLNDAFKHHNSNP